eukprot:7928975-Pyramimonas_sp.AAC.1
MLAVSGHDAVQRMRTAPFRHVKGRVGQPLHELCDSIAKYHAKKFQNTTEVIGLTSPATLSVSYVKVLYITEFMLWATLRDHRFRDTRAYPEACEHGLCFRHQVFRAQEAMTIAAPAPPVLPAPPASDETRIPAQKAKTTISLNLATYNAQ